MADRRILIRGGTVLSMDERIGELDRGDVLVEGRTIRDVAPRIDEEVDEVIDATRMFVTPGFVDAHAHLWQTPIRGAAAHYIGPEYQANVKRLRQNYTAADKYAANYVGALELIGNGTTTSIDHVHDIPSVEEGEASLRGTRDAGLRSLFCPSMNPRRAGFRSTHEERLELAREFARQIEEDDGDGLLTAGMALTDMHFVHAAGDRWDWNRRESEFAREHGLHMTVHSTTFDHFWRFAENVDLGPDILPSHCRSYNDHEYRLISEHGMSVAITPVIDFRNGLNWHVNEAVRRGINVSYGIDSVIFANGDLFHAMRLVAEAQHHDDSRRERAQGRALIRRPGLPTQTPADVLRQGTLGGAIALGLDDTVGSLTPGKEADILLIHEGEFGRSRADASAHLLYQSDSRQIDTVIIAGTVRKRGGRLVDVDMEHVRALLEESTARIFARPVEGVRRVWWAPPNEAAMWDAVAPAKDLPADVGEALAERAGSDSDLPEH